MLKTKLTPYKLLEMPNFNSTLSYLHIYEIRMGTFTRKNK